MRSALRIVCLVAACAAVAGCGHGGKAKTTTAAATTAATTTSRDAGAIVQGVHVLAVLEVHETEYKLQPKAIGLAYPGYFGIKAVNDGTVAHALAVSGHGLSARTRTLQPHESATIAVYFRHPGAYRLFCPLDAHAQRGMTALVRVA